MLSYVKYSLLFSPVVRIEPAISWWFHLDLYKLNAYIYYNMSPAG